MIQVRKAYVLVIAGLLALLCAGSASAAFGFSSPLTTIVAGPGLATAGPTTFNTYFHDATMASAAAEADAAVNGFSPVPGCLPAIPFGLSGWGPFGTASAANTGVMSNWGEDNTFATSFSNAGVTGLSPVACNFAGTFPEFAVNFF